MLLADLYDKGQFPGLKNLETWEARAWPWTACIAANGYCNPARPASLAVSDACWLALLGLNDHCWCA